MKAVLFDLYETLVTHFDPDWAPPPRSVAERLGVKETVYGERWPPLDKAWQAGEIEHYAGRRWRGFARRPAGSRMPPCSRSRLASTER